MYLPHCHGHLCDRIGAGSLEPSLTSALSLSSLPGSASALPLTLDCRQFAGSFDQYCFFPSEYRPESAGHFTDCCILLRS